MQKKMVRDVISITSAADRGNWCHELGEPLTCSTFARSITDLAKSLSEAVTSNSKLHYRSKNSHCILRLIYQEYVSLMGDDHLAWQAMRASLEGRTLCNSYISICYTM